MTTAETVKTEKPGMKRRHVAWQLEFEIQASIKRCIPCTVISILNKELWSKGLSRSLSPSVFMLTKMAPNSLSVRLEESFTRNALRSYLAEFISTFIFVFAAVGSAMSSRKLMPDATSDPSSLLVVALANAFALSSAVYIAAGISGGHVNPAVTFGLAVGGHVSIPTAMLYWISQMLGATMACLFLRVTTVGQHVPTHAIAEEMTGFGASVLEGVLTFALVYTVYAAGDPRRGPLGSIGPLAIGLIEGANVLAAGHSREGL
ncbi:putative aquaporin TIP5-1 [Vitis vinifera]|uniref:Putative aquaporin TIP5-1 n=1 Tax=Vitis vinifera TaxID=29760 RepID=A0A438C7S9_VITVI|nr:putative aquaporin TIP5-1 [Vitis vinifera]